MIGAALVAAVVLAAPTDAVSVRDIVEAADISSPVVSPDGHFVAFRVERPSVERNSVECVWFVAAVDASSPARPIGDGGSGLFTSAGTLVAEKPIWSGDSHFLYFRALIDGSVQIWRADVDAVAAKQMTVDGADVGSFAISPDGRTLTYRTGALRTAIDAAEQRTREDGALVDETVDLALGVSGGAIVNGRPTSQRLTGHWFERRGLLDDRPEQVKVLMLETVGPPTTVTFKKTSPDDAHVGSSIASMFARDKTQVCEVLRCGLESVVRSQPIGGDVRLVTLQSPAFEQSLYRWNPRSRSIRAIYRGGGLIGGGRNLLAPCSLTATYALCVHAAATTPPRLLRLSLRDGATITMFDPNAALRARIATPVKLLTWRDPQGQQFTGQLVLPRRTNSRSPPPLVIDYYRCPGFLRGGVGDETPLLPLADAGIATLCINAAFAKGAQNSRQDYAVALSGVETIVSELGTRGVINPHRVGMSGLSFGSEVVMWIARHSSLLAAAVIASGQLEPGYYWYNAVRGRDVPNALKTGWGLGDPEQDRAGWTAISPALDSNAIRAPLLMQLPELEARWSMELYAKLSRSTTPVELYAFPDAAHVKSQPRQKLAANARALDWLAFWLAGREQSDAGKIDQYRRWRALAERRSGVAATDDRRHP